MRFVILATLIAPGAVLPAAESTNELRTAGEIRRLSPSEADQHFPARLRGTLTFFEERVPSKAYRFVQDETAGIYIYPVPSADLPALQTGQRVEITGFTGKGEFAPVINATNIEVLGPGVFPAARPVSFDQLVSGREDSQFVEVQGIVRAVGVDDATGYHLIELTTGGGRLTVSANALPVAHGPELVDSTLRVRGVAITQFNLRRQLFDIRLLAPRVEDVSVVEPAPADPFNIPAQPISSLLQFAPEGAYGHRVKVLGTVTGRPSDDTLYLQEGGTGLLVETRQPGPLAVGDRVEVLGFPAKGDYTPKLQDAIFRQAGHGQEPAPTAVQANEALKGTHDAQLVSIEATLLDRARQSRGQMLVLQAGDTIFQAVLDPVRGPDAFADLQNGSRVRATGVCLIDPGGQWQPGENWRAESFRLRLRSPGDVTLLRAPPWWTLPRLLWIVGLLAGVVLAAFVWVGVLRRRVTQQTQIIRHRLQAEEALKERYVDLFENANDVVFTHNLEGRLTSINQAGEKLLHRARATLLGQPLLDLISPDERDEAAGWLAKVVRGEEPAAAEWDFVDASSQRHKLEISSRPVHTAGRLVEVESVGRDITERKRLEREILDISNREQRRIGHDLHDGVCQQLAGIAFLSNTLAEKLQERSLPEAAEAEKISGLINEANRQTRGVARGLFPVRLEENGLISALEELTVNAAAYFRMECRFACEQAPPAIENGIALHLYCIAQEALVNAAKHGKARQVQVTLAPAREHERWLLTIADDGRGFAPVAGPRTGMGIRIMQYRARVIGATLDLKSQPGTGTQVTCQFFPATR